MRITVILDRILEHKKAEFVHKNSRGYLAELKTKIRDAGPTLGFAVTLDARRTPTRPALIAEVKRRLPVSGYCGLSSSNASSRSDRRGLSRAWGDGVSVLTDKRFFQGTWRIWPT